MKKDISERDRLFEIIIPTIVKHDQKTGHISNGTGAGCHDCINYRTGYRETRVNLRAEEFRQNGIRKLQADAAADAEEDFNRLHKQHLSD